MTRYRIAVDLSLDPPYVLHPDPYGPVCLAETALTEIGEAKNSAAASEAYGEVDGVKEGVRAAAAWLIARGKPVTAKNMLEDLL